LLINNDEYLEIIDSIKSKIRQAKHRAMFAVNGELVTLYWNIGKIINERNFWGSKFIDNLARDIKLEFPNTKGYSVRNLKYMAKFAKTYGDLEFVQTVSAQLSWSHNTVLLDKIKDEIRRIWYAKKAIELDWTLNTLEIQIEYQLYERQILAKKDTNFNLRLEAPQKQLAEQALKSPYIFDFINYRQDMVERDIENELVRNITKLLLELGTGFAFVGQQYHIEVENEDFYIDLLFYNVKLHCYFVVELKNTNFKPEYVGKLNFYVSAIDSILRSERDEPTIGLLLCRNKKGLVAEYSLRDIEKPIGVSEYKLFEKLPKKYEEFLPSIEDIESRIDIKVIDDEKND
jgi:predicted nuclease of restriction endonuclease-like (RecB) superfamily